MAVYKRGKVWYARLYWRDAQKKRHSKTKGGFKTKRLASDWYATERAKHNEGIKVDKNPIFVDYFWKHYEIFSKPHCRYATRRTFKRARDILENYWKDTRIKEINKTKWQEFLNFLGKKYAKTSNVMIFKKYHSAIMSAIDEGIITIDFTRKTKITGCQARTRMDKVHFPSVAQIKKINQVAMARRSPRLMSASTMSSHNVTKEKDEGNLADYLLSTQIMTGARLGEASGLRWKDLHFDNDTIDIHHSYNSDNHQLGPTKTKSSYRTISVNKSLLNMLLELKVNDCDYVFGSKATKLPPNELSVNNELRRVLKEAGVPSEGFSSHTLRHAHVALLLHYGADWYEIRDRMGHTDIKTTLDRYGYLTEESKKNNDELIRNSLSNLM